VGNYGLSHDRNSGKVQCIDDQHSRPGNEQHPRSCIVTSTVPTTDRRQALFGFGAAAVATAAATAVSTTGAHAQGSGATPLSGKVAIVSGARANLGRGCAIALGALGASVVVHHHRAASKGEADATAAEVVRVGGKAAVIAGDLTKLENVRAMYDLAERQFGGVDIVVNNSQNSRMMNSRDLTPSTIVHCSTPCAKPLSGCATMAVS
jgi:hypothetical protein